MNQETKTRYKAVIMSHFKQPKNKRSGSFPEHYFVARGRNPSCGDDIEIGVQVGRPEDGSEQTIAEAGFRGRGCSICLASASMLTESVLGKSEDSALRLVEQMKHSVSGQNAELDSIPEALKPLSAVAAHPARHRCVLLAWNALEEAINQRHNKT